MNLSNALTASLEDYLEAIFNIIAEKKAVRPKDIAQRLKVSNSSVTGALRSLAEKKLINYAPYDVISLTQNGEIVAKDVIRRHEVLKDFFIKVLAVDKKDADEAACKMEHSIPKIILERFIQFAEFIEVCPRGGSKWIAGFGYRCDHNDNQEYCEKCIETTLKDIREKRKAGGMKKMSSVSLKELQPGQKAKVVKIKSRGPASRRIVEMGITTNSIVEVERVAPMGDPIDIKVKGYHLSLRKDEAAGIEVEII